MNEMGIPITTGVNRLAHARVARPGLVINAATGLVAAVLLAASASRPQMGANSSTAAQSSQSGDGAIRALGQEELNALRRKKEQYYAMPESTRRRIGELHEQLESHPNKEHLRAILNNYYEWFKNLDQFQQDEVMNEKDIAKRVELIREIRNEQAEQPSLLPISEKDKQLVNKWLLDLASANAEKIRQKATELATSNPRGWFSFGGRDNSRNSIANEIADAPTETLLRRLIVYNSIRGSEFDTSSIVTDADLNGLISQMSAETKAMIPEDRRYRMRALVMLILRPYASEEELRKFFANELTQEHRNYLDRLSPELMNRQLRQWYGQRKLGRRVEELQIPTSR